MNDDSSPFLADDMAMDGDTPAIEPTSRMLSWARNSALYRLEQRMMTEKQLRDAIMRKAREKFEDISPAQVRALGEFAVTFAYGIKALDDTAFAEITVRSGQRSGKSKRGLAQKLQIKGIARETAAVALQEQTISSQPSSSPASAPSGRFAVSNWTRSARPRNSPLSPVTASALRSARKSWR